MKRISAILLSVLCALSAFNSVAQRQGKPLTDEDRQRIRSEIRSYKHEFLARELEMSREQQREFFPVYDEMDEAVDRINFETRELERKVSQKADASEVEIEAAARAVFSQKSAEGEVEKQYFDRFRQILSGKQLLRLRKAERKFTQRLMRHHRRAAGAEKKNGR
jgi:Spy/CpxP family protein refolding chaperone